MEYIRDISINEAVIHVLDNNADEPILNEYKLELNEEVYSFLSKHTLKCFRDEELKYAVFNDEKNTVKNITQQFLNQECEFLEVSKELAKQMFILMRSKGSINSCDLIIVNISTEYGPMIGIMKMDYIRSYFHDIEVVEDKIGINIVPQHTGLPAGGQKIQKCAFVKPIRDENSFDLMVIDKQTKNKKSEEYGSSYFTNNYLGCKLISNERDITKDFVDAAERWTRTNLKENAEMQEKVRKTIKDKLKEEEEFDVKEVAEELFGDETVGKESFVNFIKEEGRVEKVAVDKEWVNKKFKKIRLKIDKDIDIYLNEDAYNDNSRFEIKRNGDGTINMIIKHVSNYIEK
ncbi:nucleoid-associated protein [Clostridium botulinum D/C]|uniref:nucleoid-associated protein n=1 Tax=Clostridium botulinum TaxID=1491 RepID=UPI001E60CDDA|nr:nucleoid-associated protein [Clostridium botulinum]MCD3234297.1 nucleoid-associated protein [Clostridium botulinum D/C]MCD3240281.1 nucleoid-associated protein [Clostridium botulinum D/C]MCD3267716.1 nucleoid-associated protein [Clostridium botulinum D/C]MCD3306113.1 nucleoid-associated protein [Clostridium botulinum D/C]MCD3314897.1 nucleoid-associated protein [Clostridium botulinum D/C]